MKAGESKEIAVGEIFMPGNHAVIRRNMPNGVAPFNYRKFTPEQESRGAYIATIILQMVSIIGALAYAIYVPFFKPHPTDLDTMCGGAYILVVIIGVREFWRTIKS